MEIGKFRMRLPLREHDEEIFSVVERDPCQGVCHSWRKRAGSCSIVSLPMIAPLTWRIGHIGVEQRWDLQHRCLCIWHFDWQSAHYHRCPWYRACETNDMFHWFDRLDSFQTILNDLQGSLTVDDPQLRPRWTMLLKTDLFQWAELFVSDKLESEFWSIDLELIISKRPNFSIVYQPLRSQICRRWSSELHRCSRHLSHPGFREHSKFAVDLSRCSGHDVLQWIIDSSSPRSVHVLVSIHTIKTSSTNSNSQRWKQFFVDLTWYVSLPRYSSHRWPILLPRGLDTRDTARTFQLLLGIDRPNLSSKYDSSTSKINREEWNSVQVSLAFPSLSSCMASKIPIIRFVCWR